MIKNKNEKQTKQIEIDLTGPQGNAYNLLAQATKLAKVMGLNSDEITAEMTSGDYENLIDVFEKYFGDFVILYR